MAYKKLPYRLKIKHLGSYDRLAYKYYKRPFAQLLPFQKDKVINWVTNNNPNYGSSKDRRHGRTLGRFIKGKL